MDQNRFTPEAILAENLEACMRVRQGPNSENELAKRSNVAQSTIGRIRARTQAAKIDTVAKLAKVYGLEAWQMMVAGMDPANPPALQPVSKTERELHERLRNALLELAALEKHS